VVERDLPSVRRPRRVLAVDAAQPPAARPVRAHDPDPGLSDSLSHPEGDSPAVGRPGWRVVQASPPRQIPRLRPVRVHHVDLARLLVLVAVRDPSPVGRPRGIEIRLWIVGQAHEPGAVGMDDVDFRVNIVVPPAPDRERNAPRRRVRDAGGRQRREGGEGESENCETSHESASNLHPLAHDGPRRGSACR
jgi:hypothetical protein